MEPKPKTSKSIIYYMRLTHRIVGYLLVGLVIVYSLSGITLIHRTGDFLKKTIPTEVTLTPGLSADELGAALKIKGLKVTEETGDLILFGDGQYNKATGEAKYDKKEVVGLMSKFIDLHKMPDGKNPHIAFVTTIFGILLFLLALTSLFMYKPASKQFKANMIYTAIGIAAAVILVALV